MVGGARLSIEQRDVILAVRDAFLRSVGALMARRRQLVSTIQVRGCAAAAVLDQSGTLPMKGCAHACAIH